MYGTVRWFSNLKGYGFIVGDDHRDYFIHKSSLPRSLREGDRVAFTARENPKGPEAINLARIEEAKPEVNYSTGNDKDQVENDRPEASS